jgi:hypothetical protein
MDHNAANTALRRASKAFSHATRQLAEAQSESARKRHARRAMNAQRHMAEARRTFEEITSYGAA